MMEDKIHFYIRVAHTDIEVHCCFLMTQEYCRDYRIPDSQNVDLVVDIGQGDIEAERAYQVSLNDHEQLEAVTPEALEILVLCRKIAEKLPERGMVLFHGSALSFDGKGVLFTATSGTGKSTHAALWRKVFGRRVRMVNDDKPFLSLGAEGIYVHGSPWRGKHRLGENTEVPVRAICLLNRGEENRIEPVSPREALPVLMQQTYQPKAPGALLQTMVLVDRLSREVPVFRLFCNMNEDAARVALHGVLPNDEENDL